MIAKYLGYNLSQNTMASKFGTTASSGTSAGESTAKALNDATGKKSNYTWHWQSYSDAAGLKNKVLASIGAYIPIMANTVEGPGDWFILGHNTGGTLYHFGVINAYAVFGDSVTYLDPGAGRFVSFIKSQSVSTVKMSKALGGRGIVW